MTLDLTFYGIPMVLKPDNLQNMSQSLLKNLPNSVSLGKPQSGKSSDQIHFEGPHILDIRAAA